MLDFKMNYKSRIIDDILKFKLEVFGGVLIVGPKGCGKTTTAKQISKSIIEFQDEDKREQYLSVANIMPSKLLIGEKPILFVEWQEAVKIWGAIRKSIDDTCGVGMYLLTSSLQDINTPHTGTMRISRLNMSTMSLYESNESTGEISLLNLFNNPHEFKGCYSKLPINGLIKAICRGGWPSALNVKDENAQLEIVRNIYKRIHQVDINTISKIKRNSNITHAILKSYSKSICTLANAKTIFEDVILNYELSKPTFYEYIADLKKLFIIEDIDAWRPSIRSKTQIKSSSKRNLVDPSIAVAAMGLTPEYFNKDFKTLEFLFKSLCYRDLKIYSQAFCGKISYYKDRLGLEVDCVLHLNDDRYALIEFKLGSNELDKAAKNLCEIERLILVNNKTENKYPLRLPDLKIIITNTDYGYLREDGVYVIPIGCLKD